MQLRYVENDKCYVKTLSEPILYLVDFVLCAAAAETVLNICGHMAGLIIATLNLHNNRSSKVNKKSVVPASPKYIKVQSV